MPVSSVSFPYRGVKSDADLLRRSAIISPLDKSIITHDGFIELKGWAYSGGGNWVERVEVSPDGCVFVFREDFLWSC